MISTMSMRQALEVWAKLEDAFHGEASHGSTTEIYAYELAPYDPKAKHPGLSEDSSDQLGNHAARNLRELLVLFVELKRCMIRLNDDRNGQGGILFKPGSGHGIEPFDHRIHVRIIGGDI